MLDVWCLDWYIWEVVDPIRCGAERSGEMPCGGD